MTPQRGRVNEYLPLVQLTFKGSMATPIMPMRGHELSLQARIGRQRSDRQTSTPGSCAPYLKRPHWLHRQMISLHGSMLKITLDSFQTSGKGFT